MAKFVDRLGREWELEIDLSLLAPLREAGLNVGDVMRDPKLFGGFTHETMGRVLWVACEEQAKARGLSPEEFAKGFSGPVIYSAGDALWSALLDFGQRPAVATAIKNRLPALMRKAETEAVAEIDRLLSAAATTGSSASAGGSPASSASTHDG